MRSTHTRRGCAAGEEDRDELGGTNEQLLGDDYSMRESPRASSVLVPDDGDKSLRILS